MTSAVAATDRSDFRNVLVSGTKVGVVTGAAVIVSLLLTRLLLPVGMLREVVFASVVLGAGVLVSLLPGHWAVSRNTEGVAGAAAIGLWGTVVFSVIDIALLRPLKAYPWTWDAVGGGSTWWYLPIWWMLGTFLAWMGGMLTAGRNARGPVGMPQIAAIPVIGAIILTVAGKVTGCPAALPVLAGAGYAVALTTFAVASLVRRA